MTANHLLPDTDEVSAMVRFSAFSTISNGGNSCPR